jgi:peptidoglycan-N-acetylglucosamine deacetylase
VLAILARRGVQATFFLVGQRAKSQPDLVRRAAAAGHELGNHTWAHTDLTHLNEASARGALERTHEFIVGLTGRAPTLCRPPYGRIDSVGLEVCAALKYGVALWSDHVTGSNARANVDTVLRQATPGSIVLAHDGGSEPNAALMTQLDRLIGAMADEGYTFVTVSQLLAAPARLPAAAGGLD